LFFRQNQRLTNIAISICKDKSGKLKICQGTVIPDTYLLEKVFDTQIRDQDDDEFEYDGPRSMSQAVSA
jgi:hypothetical protein